MRSSSPGRAADWDCVVVGAGFAGLATALSLAENGARVKLCESLKYPGGCASTFTHRGFRFEAGATLFSGFGEGQIFRRWIDRYQLPVVFEPLDPAVELRAPDLTLPISSQRSVFEARFLDLPGAPRKRLERFFRLQRRVADLLWPLFDDPDRLPPFSLSPSSLAAGGWHLRRSLGYLPLLWLVGRPVGAVLERFGLAGFTPLRTFLDALCQITVQCGVDEAEAPFALSAMDYYFRGTGHVRGGIGSLAWGLVDAIRQAGGEVSLTDRVREIEPRDGSFLVRTRRGEIKTRSVVANLLPAALRKMVGERLDPHRWLRRAQERVETGWGACMLYRVLRPPRPLAGHPHHFELIADPRAPLQDGNHLFCSLSGPEDGDRAPEGYRTLTVSTHAPLAELRTLPQEQLVARIDGIHARMNETIDRLAPELGADVEHQMTASPRTFERFTGRPEGFVGGIPRRAGWGSYRDLIPPRILPGLYLVGDSIFPGQSTLGAAIGGIKTAGRLVREERAGRQTHSIPSFRQGRAEKTPESISP